MISIIIVRGDREHVYGEQKKYLPKEVKYLLVTDKVLYKYMFTLFLYVFGGDVQLRMG